MGIKGIYGELGSGQRVSLAKLAADTLRAEGRPLRLAIDVAIWQFQAQAARGGTNPAIRTLFYRLVRLLAIPVQPVCVFDGPNKPTTKRHKRSGRGDGLANSQAKRLIRLFGLPALDAPGEAEAECALLQRHGIVDAVLSEDVDTIMFGCTKTLRNWSSEGKTTTGPTHVSLYDTASVANHGLDRQGMVLVALMSGGDYLPVGIFGCGVKVACEAAAAGFGSSLCRLKASDTDGIDAWRAELRHELATNESGHFRTKHKSLVIPDDFPNMEVLRYYTHPVVSPQNNLDAIRQRVQQQNNVQLQPLREFTRETFGWDYREGAIKFIRVLGQAMLVQNLMQSRNLIQDISKRRTHFSTDATSELRLSYIPQEVVPIDLSTEVAEDTDYGRDGLALNSDEDLPPARVTATKTPQLFDVAVPELAWVLEGVVKHYAPESTHKFETAEAVKALRKSPTKKLPNKSAKPVKDAGMPNGAIDSFFRISKNTTLAAEGVTKEGPPPPQRNMPPSVGAIVQSQELPPLPRPPKTHPRSPTRKTAEPVLKKPASLPSENRQLPDDPFDADSSLLSISDLVPAEPSSPSKRRPHESQVTVGDRSGSPTPPHRKKLLVPGAAGLLREIEVDIEERDEVIAREEARLIRSRIKGKVARWSDISIIDLTEG
ncbi:hypothetical protein V2A60_005396 [Cordyceps javanica]|uniref:Nuclease-like protein n=1 Tax=Cordyceps javanica TaxID=43265 RepID=A0A545W8X5_9HYPO|nr:nuclease-like protein [Cordyceps javanica]TQW10346.1 nuclease-like protein [Cordyceps javanica]